MFYYENVAAAANFYGNILGLKKTLDWSTVKFLKRIGDGGGIRSFLIEDPGGYTVEYFDWLDIAN
jgi:hypothetical protein